MPILRITAGRQGPRLHGVSDPLLPGLQAALDADPGPVTVMVHGYKYLPGDPVHCPHDTLLSRRPARRNARIVSWPTRLGLRGQGGEGLGISFGWAARGSVWTAHGAAGRAGDGLADLLAALRRFDRDRPVRIVAHSMGARVALRALSLADPGAVTRMILLAAAEFDATAQSALDSPGGRDCAVLNVTSRENDLFDFLVERLIAPPVPGDRVLGAARLDMPNLAHLQIDDPATLAILRRTGFPVADATRRVCHWSPYLRPGLFPLYRAVLDGRMPLPRLRALLPDQHAPRWSRLLPSRAAAPLPGTPALR